MEIKSGRCVFDWGGKSGRFWTRNIRNVQEKEATSANKIRYQLKLNQTINNDFIIKTLLYLPNFRESKVNSIDIIFST